MNIYSNEQTRRTFLKSATLASAGVILAGSTQGFPSILTGRQKKMGIALMGLGWYSTDILAPALEQCETAYLAGIVTGTPEKEKIWKEKYSIPAKNIYNYENFDEIASNPDIDIIYVVLPNSMHKEFTIRAARAKKHVICEKPMALNAIECREMIAACEENGVGLSVGYRMQYEPYTQEIMRLGQEKVFGNVLHVSCGAAFRHSGSNHWKLQKAMGGGSMMDMGVYPLQAARYSTGLEPTAVTAQSYQLRPDKFTEIDEATTLQLEFPGGAIASLSTGFHASYNFLKVSAETGWFQLEPFSGFGGIKGRTNQGELNFPSINQQATQMDEDAISFARGISPRVPGLEGLKDMLVVDAVYEAAKTGKRITVGKI